MTRGKIELIARGMLVNGNTILLVRKKHKKYSFLPGGHIKPGESAKKALAREFEEETGFRAMRSCFLGVVEHAWQDKGKKNHEINFIFVFKCKAYCRLKVPASSEPKLEFFWQSLSDLSSVNLQPGILQKLLPRWLKSEPPDNWAVTF